MATTITMKTNEYGSMTIEVNGRYTVHAGRIVELNRVSAARWVGRTHGGYSFEISGGRLAGGTKNDWFVVDERISNQPIHVSSARAAVRLIENL